MHAHTGVMSHLLAPRDCGMVARDRLVRPRPDREQRASVGVDRAGSGKEYRDSGEEPAPSGTIGPGYRET